MPLKTLLIGLTLLVSGSGQSPRTTSRRTDGRPNLVASTEYGFSVAVPSGWFVFKNKGLPVLITYPPEEALPQWQLPPGGAMIEMLLCPAGGVHPRDPTLYSCEEHQFAVEHAAVTGGERDPGPPALGSSMALLGLGEQVPLGTPSQTLRLITAFWRYGDKVFGVQLSYIAGDPDRHYKQILLDVMRSFRPTL